jgi:hypothetical protein
MRQDILEEFFRVYRATRQAHPDIFAAPLSSGQAKQETSSLLPVCMQRLGLTWPCTRHEVQQAFRRQAKAAHPDRGGTNESFHRLYQAYQEALMCAK